SDQFIEFLERKLDENGIEKLIPSHKELARAYTMFAEGEELKAEFAKIREDSAAKRRKVKVPKDLAKRVAEVLDEHPEIPWPQAVHSLLDSSVLSEDDEL